MRSEVRRKLCEGFEGYSGLAEDGPPPYVKETSSIPNLETREIRLSRPARTIAENQRSFLRFRANASIPAMGGFSFTGAHHVGTSGLCQD